MYRFLFPIKIHIWGGLGSQLYGLALAYDLAEIRSSTRIKLVFHSSGVTKRQPNIDKSLVPFSVNFVDDFTTISSNSHSISSELDQKSFTKIIKFLIKKFLLKTGLVIDANNDSSFSKIRFWTFEIRGHYSLRSIRINTLEKIFKTLFYSELKNPTLAQDLAIHFRLGDLLYLTNKSPTDVNRFINILSDFKDSNADSIIAVFSDSPDQAKKIVLHGLADYQQSQINFPIADLIESVRSMVSTRFFIATSSKISEWALLFRELNVERTLSWIPIEMMEFSQRNRLSKIRYYN